MPWTTIILQVSFVMLSALVNAAQTSAVGGSLSDQLWDEYETSAVGGSLSDQLWDEAEDLRMQILNTEFIQGIGHGNLHPNDYGGYMVQDAIYCLRVADNFGIAKRKSQGYIRDYLEGEELVTWKAYIDYNYQEFHIEGMRGVKMGAGIQLYIDFLESVAETMDPVYFMIALLPCYRLAPWLANEIKDLSQDLDSNMYQFWIDLGIGMTGWHELQAIVDANTHKIDMNEARRVFTIAMLGEFIFFTSATL